ncbi:MAG TPA: alpha-L-arabinofuranosidase C-terminal domain-containing protein, partial [Candidatus Hydrogenedentes bacterium]|nr:alpha-L-arabinofuranosidase C-terminal domain-containing protein [Candidatus Hydrogenedentota bacterium]
MLTQLRCRQLAEPKRVHVQLSHAKPLVGRAFVSLAVLLGVWPAMAQAAERDKGPRPPAVASVEKVRILGERLFERAIDIKQGGQFIEPLCNLIPSMLAQQVANDSFEEEPPYRVAYKQELDKPYRPWYPDGAVHAAQFALDAENAFNGRQCQRIGVPQERCRAGVSQDGFFIAEGVNYALRLHMRGEGNVRVWASLHGNGGYAAGPADLGRASASWAPAELVLKAARTVENATLTIECEGPGTLWLDRAYLIEEGAVLGLWRQDVVDALKALNPGVIRWGGSTTEGYEWTDCIGPWDRRAPFTTCWGGLEPNFVGMEEFVQLCQYIGAEPLLCLRWSGKKPEDAAAQVEYFNGSAETRWGRIRAQNGHPGPYNVKYWQIGNEVGGADYDAAVLAFAQAMKSVCPNVNVLSAFFTENTLAKGAGYIDYLCPHHYGCGDLAGKANDFQHMRDLIARDAGGRDVRIAVTEWNTTAGDWGLGRATLQTLSNALMCSRYHNLMHRNADLCEIAVRSNLVDSFGSGIIQTGPGWYYVAPTYYAQQLYQRAAGSQPLRLERESTLPWTEQQPDLSATLSPDDKTLRIFAVNTSTDPHPVLFELPGAGESATATVLKDQQNALCAEVINTRDAPARIKPAAYPLETRGTTFEFAFEPLSLTLLEVTMSP